jgi:acyl-CoA reductase-like NAD-dependent aldehyde dehydrogenase
MDVSASRALLDGLVTAGEALKEISAAERAAILGKAGERFSDPHDALAELARHWVPLETGMSPEVSEQLLDRMADQWSPTSLERLLRAEFTDPRILDEFREGPEGDQEKAEGDALALHLGAGNVAGTGATSLVRSLLVGTPLLLKPGRGDVILPVLMARAIHSVSPLLSAALAVVYWPGGSSSPLEEEALARSRRVVLYGGLDTAREIRSRVPVTTPLVLYHHRLSAGAIGRDRLEGQGPARELARAAAESVAAYDQQGCVSPHTIWVEEGGAVGVQEWAGLLAEALEEVNVRLPAARPTPEVSGEIQQLRGMAELEGAAGEGQGLFAPRDTSWTVILETEFGFYTACGGRLVRIQPLSDLDQLPELLAPFAPLLQSLALEVEAPRRARIGAELGRAGVSRITSFRRIAWPRPWWLHDGQGPLRALVRWVTLERDSPKI